jgi:hypothetical protein
MDFLIRLFGTVVGYIFGLMLGFFLEFCKALLRLLWRGLVAWWAYLTHPMPAPQTAKSVAPPAPASTAPQPIAPPKPQPQAWTETSRAPTRREPKPNHGYQVTSK